MAADASRTVSGSSVVDAPMKMMCSHGGHLVPCGPNGAPRYVGGQTRVLVVPRSVPFRDLAARLSEMAGGAEVRAVRHRLADAGLEDDIVSVTCDEELALMRNEYDRLRATRPTARFRLFVDITTAPASTGSGVAHQPRAASVLPPLAPRMRRARSDHALAASAQRLHWRPPIPCRCGTSRVRWSSPGPAACSRPSTTGATSAATPANVKMRASIHVQEDRQRRVRNSVAAAAKTRSRDAKSPTEIENRRAIWEFECCSCTCTTKCTTS